MCVYKNVFLRKLKKDLLRSFGGRSANRQQCRKKAFDRGGPVWPPRPNAKDDRTAPQKKRHLIEAAPFGRLRGSGGALPPPAKTKGTGGSAPQQKPKK